MSFPDLLAPPVMESTHRAEQELGPAVVDGVVRWASQSLITLADPSQVGGCQRRFHYKHVEKRPEPAPRGKARETGTKKLHEPIERLLKFGDRSLLNDIVLAGMRYIPEPGPDLLVEFPICYKREDGTIDALVHAAGVPIAGHVDLVDPRRKFIRDDGEELFDPQNTIEIHDWKSTSSVEKYAKSGHELGSTIQMPLYAKALSEMRDGYANGLIAWIAAQKDDPEAERKAHQMRVAIGYLPRNSEYFRLSQVFFGTKKRESQKATLLLRKVDVEKRWTSIEEKMRGILGLAKASCADDVPGNPLACELYPPDGCPYRTVCSVGNGNSLASVFGQSAANALLGKSEGGNHVMSLLDALNPSVVVAPAPVVAAAVTLPVAAQAVDPVAAARAALAKAEADAEAARVAAQQPAPVAAPVQLPPSPVTDALDAIARTGHGVPTVVGPLAVLTSTARGAFSTADIPGNGALARMVLHHADQLIQFAKLTAGQIAQVTQLPDAQLKQLSAELAVAAGAQPWDESQRIVMPQPVPAVPAVSILPTDVPTSNPALAAIPLPAETTAPVQTPILPGVGGQPAPATLPAAPQTMAQALAASPKKRGRKSNAEKAAEAAAAQASAGVAAPVTTAATLPTPAPVQADADVSEFEAAVDGMMILVVGVVPSVPAESLAPWVDMLAKKLCERFNVRDIRLAPEGSPLAFGKWKPAIAAYARELVEQGLMPKGIYYADGNDEITNEVIAGLRPLCHFFARSPGR